MSGTAYEDFVALQERVPANLRPGVASLQAQAMAYVWGREDAGEAKRSDNAPWEFSFAYGVHAARYALGELGSRWAIRNAWDVWSTGGTIGVYPESRS